MGNWLSICKNHSTKYFPFLCMTSDLMHSFNSHPQLLYNLKKTKKVVFYCLLFSHTEKESYYNYMPIGQASHISDQHHSLSLSHSSNYYIATYLLLSIYFS